MFKAYDTMLWTDIFVLTSLVLASHVHYPVYRIIEYCWEKHVALMDSSYFEGFCQSVT